MTNLLHIIATPRGLASNTGRISALLLNELDGKYEDLEVRTLDLFSADLPAVAGINIKSKYALMTGQPLDEDARTSWAEIEKTIERFLAADVYLLTVPMWNFGVPYALKYYIDAIVQPGYLFAYDDVGRPHGLVHGKKMICVTSRGADYSGAPLSEYDYLENYLSTIFGFVGITDMTFFNVQPMDIAPLRKQAFRTAANDVRSWVANGAWDASRERQSDPLPVAAIPRVIVDQPR